MKQNFSTKHDSLFPKGVKALAAVIGLFAVFGLFENTLVSVVFLLVCSFVFFSDQGAEFRPQNKLFRHYIGFLGIHSGAWKSYKQYPDMALLSKRITINTYSRGNVQLSQSELVHELYLLSSDHRKKVLAYVFKNLETAENANPKMLADELGVNYTTYAPKVSAQTAARRRR